MQIFSFSFQNFKERPNEDYFLISKKYPIFAVADGVTRYIEAGEKYPKISGARLAAEEFCQATLKCLGENFEKPAPIILKKVFSFANKKIFNLNEKYGINKKIDYLGNDYFSTCGLAVFIKENILHYGYIGNCEIRVYNENDFLKFYSINEVEILEEWRDNKYFKSKREYHLVWRKFLRNKPEVPYLTYGVLTGERESLNYCHFGKIKLKKGDLILLYSDGFLHWIEMFEFREIFRKGDNEEKIKRKVENSIKKEIGKNLKEKNTETFGDDKTLISILI